MKKIFIASLIIFIFGTIYPAYATLIGYWDFNEGQGSTAYDKSGYNNHGTISGAEWTTGIEGTALNFDGSLNDFVSTMYSPSLQPTDGISIMAWINLASIPTQEPGSYQIVTHEIPAYSYRFQIGKDGELCLVLEDWESEQINQYGEIYLWAGQVYQDQWHHVATTYSSSDRFIKIYIDGELIGISQEFTGGDGKINYTFDQGISIGKGRSTTGWRRAFHGLIDEVAIYDNALSVDEINSIYLKNGPTPVPEPSTFFLLLSLLGFAGLMRKTKS